MRISDWSSDVCSSDLEQRELAHVLAGGLGLDLDSGLEKVVGHRQPEPPGAAREERREQPLEVLADVGVGPCAHLDDLAVDRLDDLRQVAAWRPHFAALRLWELSALLHRVRLPGGSAV